MSTTEYSAGYELLRSEQAEQHQPVRLTTMGHEEQLIKPGGREGDSLANYTALTAAGVLTAVTWMIVIRNDPGMAGWFAFHPTLQTLSIFFFTYGILTLQPTSQPKTKAAGLARHQVAMFLLGFPCIMIGAFSVMYHKWLKQKDEVITWHATLGVICLTWIVVQIVIGGASVWSDGAAFGGDAKAKAIWKYHRLSGYLLFPMLLFTIHLGGGQSHWGARYTGPALRITTYTLAPILILVSVFVRTRSSKMNFS